MFISSPHILPWYNMKSNRIPKCVHSSESFIPNLARFQRINCEKAWVPSVERVAEESLISTLTPLVVGFFKMAEPTAGLSFSVAKSTRLTSSGAEAAEKAVRPSSSSIIKTDRTSRDRGCRKITNNLPYFSGPSYLTALRPRFPFPAALCGRPGTGLKRKESLRDIVRSSKCSKRLVINKMLTENGK